MEEEPYPFKRKVGRPSKVTLEREKLLDELAKILVGISFDQRDSEKDKFRAAKHHTKRKV